VLVNLSRLVCQSLFFWAWLLPCWIFLTLEGCSSYKYNITICNKGLLANIWNLIHRITSCSFKLILWRTLPDLSLFDHKECGVEILDWSLWHPDRLIKVSLWSIPHLIYLKITIIQSKHQKKDNTTRPILHPFSSDSLLPIFKSFAAHHTPFQNPCNPSTPSHLLMYIFVVILSSYL